MNRLSDRPVKILAVDCCQHVIKALNSLPSSRLLAVASKETKGLNRRDEVDLIAIGIARYPIRRLFVSQLRSIYPKVPILVLRREHISPGGPEGLVRGEFVLSDQSADNRDCVMVAALRKIMPFQSCEHLERDQNYEAVRKVVSVLTKRYSEPRLDLRSVARDTAVSPKRLSLILNQEVGVSFRQLLRRVRIEEAKRLLRTRQYSVKEVAARVGFTDSHYFSRSFKEFTGQSAGEYQDQTVAL